AGDVHVGRGRRAQLPARARARRPVDLRGCAKRDRRSRARAERAGDRGARAGVARGRTVGAGGGELDVLAHPPSAGGVAGERAHGDRACLLAWAVPVRGGGVRRYSAGDGQDTDTGRAGAARGPAGGGNGWTGDDLSFESL